jgi:hypothetical protein
MGVSGAAAQARQHVGVLNWADGAGSATFSLRRCVDRARRSDQ